LPEIWAHYLDPSGQLGPNYWFYFAHRLAELVSIPEGAAILDVGTCDGNVLFKAMPKAGTRGYGVGVDLYDDGLQDGLAFARRDGWENVAFARMDANCLGFPGGAFDVVLANFVGWDDCFDFERMRFITPDRMMAEMQRVLKPGGQVGIGGWVEQCDIEWIAAAFRKYLPERVKGLGERNISYSKENPEGHRLILQNSGFENIRLHVETATLVSPDAETWWQQMKRAAREYFEQVPDMIELERFKEQVFADLEAVHFPDSIRFNKIVSFAFGAKVGGARKNVAYSKKAAVEAKGC
jgi:ubiquinone/menaquinone biosynthesis C-methylase UbiE